MPKNQSDELDPLRIVHLSDPHFGARFDTNLWTHIANTVEELRPSAIVVTGDLVNSPWPRMLIVAKRQLDELARRSGAELVIIPGNHDVALQGWLPLPYLHSLYDLLVRRDAAKDVRLLTAERLPGLPGRRWVRFLQALADDVHLGFWLLRHCLSRWSMRGAGPEIARRNRLLLVGFDSNHALRQASGRITPGEIYALAESVRGTDNGAAPFSGDHAVAPFALRLGILHHHPLPIPYSDVADSLTNFESFLVLRDAGTLLSELARNHFDLVLHGHKHFQSFTRINYPGGPRGTHAMGVLAAGSATVRHRESGRNSFNVLEVARNGRTRVTTYFTGGNTGIDRDRPRQDFHLHDFDELKRRNYWRSIERQGIECDRVTKVVEIDEFGAGQHLIQVQGLRAQKGRNTSEVTHIPWVGTGRILPDTVRLRYDISSPELDLRLPDEEPNDAETPAEDPGKPLPPGPEDGQFVRIEVHFNRAVPQAPECLDYGVEYRTHNAFATSRWEALALHRAAREWTAVTVRIPCRELWLRVRLGAGIYARNPFLQCDFPSSYPRLKLDDSGYVEDKRPQRIDPAGNPEDPQRRKPIPDGETTAHERLFLRSEGSNAWVLQVPYPLVGYRYKILWDLPESVEESENSEVRGDTEMYRTLLLKVRNARRHDHPDPRLAQATDLLRRLLRALHAQFASADSAERFSLTLMAFDTRERRLVLVDGARSWDQPLRYDFSLGVGEGLAGAVFKQRRPLLYHVASLKDQAGGDAYMRLSKRGEGQPPEAVDLHPGTEYQTLLAIPVVHPALIKVARPSPLDVIAIMNIGSDSSGSRLVRLVSEKSEKARRSMDEVRAITQAAFMRYVTVLREPERGA